MLLECGAKHMHRRGALLRCAVFAKIEIIFERFVAHIQHSSGPRDIEFAAHTESRFLSEIVAPSIVVANEMFHQERRFHIFEIAVAFHHHGVAKKAYACGNIAHRLHIAGHIAQHPEFGFGIIGEHCALLLGERAAHIHQIFGGAWLHSAW